MARLRTRLVLLALATLGVQAVLGLLLARIYLTSQNTLHNNGRWISTKTTVSRLLIGAESFMRERQALARGSLDLGTWHGYQEVLLAEAVRPASVSFRFKLESGAWLVAILDRPERGTFSALRLSSMRRRPNAFLRVRPSGEFIRKTQLERRQVDAEVWHRLDLDYSPREVHARLDGRPLGSFGLPAGDLRRIGFRGSAKSTLVDDIEVRSEHRRVLRETFSGPRHSTRITLMIVAAVMVVNVLVLAGALAFGRGRRPTAGFAYAMVSTTAVVIAALVLGFLYLSGGAYPFADDLEAAETRTRAREIARVRARVLRRSAPRPEAGVHRLLFVGTSQTWGSGAARAKQVWVTVLEKLLNDDPRLDGRFECINGGISSARARHLARVLAEGWLDLEPRTVVINLGTNDTDLPELASGIERMLELSTAVGTNPLLILEPNSPAYWDGYLKERHDVMRRIGEERGVPVLDLHAYLRTRHDDGFLWWDLAHLTTFGQRLFADKLHDELVRLGLVG